MTNRVRIESNVGNPFKVSAAGVDPATASVFDLLFDGNQKPLRLYGAGYVGVNPLEHDNLAPAHFATGPGVIATPPGTFPILTVCVRNSYNPNTGSPTLTIAAHQLRPATNSQGGAGGLVAQSTFYAINWSREVVVQGGVSPLTPALCNFMIMKNYG